MALTKIALMHSLDPTSSVSDCTLHEFTSSITPLAFHKALERTHTSTVRTKQHFSMSSLSISTRAPSTSTYIVYESSHPHTAALAIFTAQTSYTPAHTQSLIQQSSRHYIEFRCTYRTQTTSQYVTQRFAHSPPHSHHHKNPPRLSHSCTAHPLRPPE